MIVFADTFALIAWLSPRDTAHQLVTAYLDAFTGRLVTTEWVLIEFADALSAPEVRGTAVAFLRAVRADALFDVVRPAQKNCIERRKDRFGVCVKFGSDAVRPTRSDFAATALASMFIGEHADETGHLRRPVRNMV
jgi:hypothetical protein